MLIALSDCNRARMYFRSKEHMESAKRTFEILNSELHDELPALHDSRLLFTVTNMQTLFAAEEVFHTETAKVTEGEYKTLQGIPIPVPRGHLFLLTHS